MWVPVCTVVAADAAPLQSPVQSKTDRRVQERFEESRRKEGEALVGLADAAMDGRAASDFSIQWRNDFLKAQNGTFVPFTLTVDRSSLTAASLLMYVRAARRDAQAPARGRSGLVRYPFDIIFPVDRPARRDRRSASRAGSPCRPATTMCTWRSASAPRIRCAPSRVFELPS